MGCNNVGSKGCLASLLYIGLFRPLSPFFWCFRPFSAFVCLFPQNLNNTWEIQKRLGYPRICLNSHLFNPRFRHSSEKCMFNVSVTIGSRTPVGLEHPLHPTRKPNSEHLNSVNVNVILASLMSKTWNLEDACNRVAPHSSGRNTEQMKTKQTNSVLPKVSVF